MARFVKVASVLIDDMPRRDDPAKREKLLAVLETQCEALAGHGLDLVVFSEEVEAVGQTVDQAERLADPGPILQVYQRFAEAERCTVAGSVKLADDGNVYNSVAFIGPDGVPLGAYHKVNLTPGEIETGLTPGPGPVVVETPAGRLGGAICFDLNFTDLCDAYAGLKPDILTFPSAYHGGLAQAWWAYRCRSFFVSALPFHGGGVLNPFGEPIITTDCYTSHAMATINLDRVMVHLDYNRDKFAAIRRQYLGRVEIHIPPNIGPAMITSTADDLSAMDVVAAYELELLDDYLVRARGENEQARSAGVLSGS